MVAQYDQLAGGEEEALRAHWYALLARLLASEPDEDALAYCRALDGDRTTELGKAVATLASAAKATNTEALREEYFNLFIGVGQGELLPFGSYYISGFLNEKPLARLRADMGALGIARAEDVSEPEDHIAALCEIMLGLIIGAFGAPASLETQKEFFHKHVASWAPRFFEDLQGAPSAMFYMPVGKIGQLFMAIETEAFDMAA